VTRGQGEGEGGVGSREAEGQRSRGAEEQRRRGAGLRGDGRISTGDRGDLIHAKTQRRKDDRHRVALRPGDFALESPGLGEPPDLGLTGETFWV